MVTSLDKDGVVALSLGATRKFRIRDYQTKKILIDYPTKDGELMWIQGSRFYTFCLIVSSKNHNIFDFIMSDAKT